MKRLVAICLAVTGLVTFADCSTGAGPACGPCAEQPCCAQQLNLRVEFTEEKYKEQVPVKKEFSTVIKHSEREVPCYRMVPVCVKDPCTGCSRTEFRQEAFMQKVKVVHVEVIPDRVCTTKTEERTKYCTKVFIEPRCAPVPDRTLPAGCR